MQRNRRSVLGLIAAVGSGGLAASPTNSEGTTRSADAGTAAATIESTSGLKSVAPATPSIEFSDQQSAGGALTVAGATLSEGGFLVLVRDEEILGVSGYLAAGQYENVSIDLNRPLFDAGEVTATIQTDTNGNQRFDATSVTLPCSQRDGENEVVSDTATVSLPQLEAAELVVDDQTVDGEVVVDSATLPEGGWVSLFAPEVGDPDTDEYVEISSSAYLEPGRYEGLRFAADVPTEPGECSAEIVALLIRDANDNREYEFEYHFPGPDYPYYPGGVTTAVLRKADCTVE